MQTTERGKMSRIRLNQEYRNKIANRMRVHLEQENTQEKQKYDELKGQQIDLNDNAWKVAEKIVRRHYTDEDVKKAQYLQDKFENVDTIAKDSCFHFHYMGTKETRDYDNNPKVEEATIEKHFDFRLNGDIDTENNSSYSRDDRGYGYALFRDELKAQDKCNPDILIEQEGKDSNPHKTKYVDANNKYLGDDDKGYGKEWNEKYQLDLIGRNYCRDRSIACTEQEFMMLQDWKKQKEQFVISHHKWISSILEQMNKVVKPCLKGWKYLDEAIDFAKKAGLDISDAEIIRTNSTGLALYNPENAVQMLNSMKNKKVKTKAEKIAERLLYEQQSQVAN